MTSKKGWMITKTVDRLVIKLKILISLNLIFFILVGCNTSTSISQCNDCNGGLVNGYLYKIVMVEDITASLLEIDSSIGLDECIRYKTDGEEFIEALVVDDCCCTVY